MYSNENKHCIFKSVPILSSKARYFCFILYRLKNRVQHGDGGLLYEYDFCVKPKHTPSNYAPTHVTGNTFDIGFNVSDNVV